MTAPAARAADGARLAARTIRALGADAVFAYPGDDVLPLDRACQSEGIRVVDVRQPQVAVHAAAAFGRVTRAAGVAIVSSTGVPGAAAAATDAHQARSAVVVIGGARPFAQKGRCPPQELDQPELFTAITNWRAVCPATACIAGHLRAAYTHAVSAPRGPAYLELPHDQLAAPISEDEADEPDPGGIRQPRLFGDPREVLRAAALINESERPILVAGDAVYLDAAERQLRFAAENGDLPVLAVGLARGVLPPDHPLALGPRPPALSGCDLVVLVGASLATVGEVAPRVRVVHVAGAATELAGGRAADVGLVGNCAAVLGILADAIRSSARPDRRPWLDRLRADRHQPQRTPPASGEVGGVHPAALAFDVAPTLGDDTALVADGGDGIAAIAASIPIWHAGQAMEPQAHGMRGAGAAVALGIATARTHARVCLLQDLAAFVASLPALETLASQDVPVLVLVVDGDAAAVRPDLVAAALGGRGERVERLGDLGAAVRRGRNDPGLAVVHAPFPLALEGAHGSTSR